MIHYIAAPYLSLDASICAARYAELCRLTADVQRHVDTVLSPAMQLHVANNIAPVDMSAEGIFQRHAPLIAASGAIVIAMLDGWRDNRLMRMEITEATLRGLKVLHAGYDYHDHFFIIQRQ
jgi:hypothetical protein